jgi:hypothetical protein
VGMSLRSEGRRNTFSPRMIGRSVVIGSGGVGSRSAGYKEA